jgi:hypothetical protein
LWQNVSTLVLNSRGREFKPASDHIYIFLK